MSKTETALKLALEALKQIDEAMPFPVAKLAQKAIREALAQPEQEPVAYVAGYFSGRVVVEPVNRALVMNTGTALYTIPPQRKPLTKTRVGNYLRRHVNGDVGMYRNGFKDGVRFAEAAHGIKE